ncbi:MAG: hypothetical protein JWM43_789 [Acidobacteriaceae bacterium]|nr:hypothetical protein [Acidobacteriaceae bacterium]
MNLTRAVLPLFLLVPVVTYAQAIPNPAETSAPAGHTLPIGTVLPVQIDGHLPMHEGQSIRAQLLYAVYDVDTLILPEHTTLLGTVTSLHPDSSRRLRARLNGDFTPFRTPVVRFTQIVLADGTTLPLTTGTATDGAPLFRLVAPPPHKGGFIHQQYDNGKQVFHDQLAVFTAPNKGDRFLQLIYHQLPYHSQRIESGTSWTVETTDALAVPAQAIPAPPPTAAETKPTAPGSEAPPTWIVNAYLGDKLSSATSKSGQAIHATVAEPIYNPDHTIAVPQGATLTGTITQAKPARAFARAGKLRFDFNQLVLPDGQKKNVQVALTGADSTSAAALAMTSEGEVKPKPQDKFVTPLILMALASRPLDRDGHHQLGKNAVGANGLGFIGNIVAMATGSAKLSAGIGFYGAATVFYDRWLARGKQVTFAQNTRLVLQTTARRSSALKPNTDSLAPR